MPKLLIVRGLPGSGKSTYAKALSKDGAFFHVETDMYFTHMDGTYNFVPSEIGKAHDWCHRQAAKALEEGKDVVVSNTFTRKWEITPYLRMAQALCADFEVVVTSGCYGNIHNVPQHTLDAMKQRWELWFGETYV